MFLFIVFALIAIVAALGVILSHKPVYSALFLLMNFGTLAALYIMLQAQFLAAVQVIVYAGAIVVLILFVVMLIGGGELGSGDRRTRGPGDTASAVPASPGRRVALGWPRITAIVLAVLLLAGVGYGIITGQLYPLQGSEADFRRRQRPGDRLGALHRLPAAIRARLGAAAGGDDWGGGAGS